MLEAITILWRWKGEMNTVVVQVLFIGRVLLFIALYQFICIKVVVPLITISYFVITFIQQNKKPHQVKLQDPKVKWQKQFKVSVTNSPTTTPSPPLYFTVLITHQCLRSYGSTTFLSSHIKLLIPWPFKPFHSWEWSISNFPLHHQQKYYAQYEEFGFS